MKQADMINLQIRLSSEMIERIDNCRLKIMMRPTRTQMIRWMLENSITALEQREDNNGRFVQRDAVSG